jgi:hypothetical protein
MLGCVEVLGGVLARRLIAAADVPALLAEPEMDPAHAGLETLFASVWRPGRHVPYFKQMHALLYHEISAGGYWAVGRWLLAVVYCLLSIGYWLFLLTSHYFPASPPPCFPEPRYR